VGSLTSNQSIAGLSAGTYDIIFAVALNLNTGSVSWDDGSGSISVS
jgi:hypothetical protein